MMRLVAWALFSVEMTAGLAAPTADNAHRTALRAFAHELHESLHELLAADEEGRQQAPWQGRSGGRSLR